MKRGELLSIAHNLADSAAGGLGFMIGVYQMDIFGEAAASHEGFIEVDFLTGDTTGATTSLSLATALRKYSGEALPRLCADHGTSPDVFRELTVRFWPGPEGGQFKVTVTDLEGRRASAEYAGSPARRVLVRDKLGRPRPKRS
jgi:hypothetical protein